jgi:lysophospholipase L1-like esterase
LTTFAALGDSITLGVGDPVRRAGSWAWRGWATLLAEGTLEPSLHILASPGARFADVERDQLPPALRLRPDIASVVVGVNDTLRTNFDIPQIAAAAAHTVGALCAAGSVVLTMRLPDPGRMLGLPGALARPLARRMHEVNAAMDAVAARFGTLHYDAAGDAECHDPRMWAVDRLHPSERGHRLIACRFHDMLASHGLLTGPRPDPEPSSPPPTRLAEFGWLATKGTAWVVRRSIDLVPGLLALTIKEWWSGQDPDLDAIRASAAMAALGASAGLDAIGPGAVRGAVGPAPALNAIAPSRALDAVGPASNPDGFGSAATLDAIGPGSALDAVGSTATMEHVATRLRARQAR